MYILARQKDTYNKDTQLTTAKMCLELKTIKGENILIYITTTITITNYLFSQNRTRNITKVY